MLGIFKKLLKKDDTSEVVKLYGKAKDERQALILLKEARKRDEGRRTEANSRLATLTNEEQILMNEGKQEDTSDARRLFLARRIKELRDDIKLVQHKVDKIYSPRLKALDQHIQSLETVIEVKSEPIPTLDSMESAAIKAKTMTEDLDIAVELAMGISTPFMKKEADSEEKGILAEMEALRERDQEKALESKEKSKKVKVAVKESDEDDDLESLEE